MNSHLLQSFDFHLFSLSRKFLICAYSTIFDAPDMKIAGDLFALPKKVLFLHLTCGLALASAFSGAKSFYSLTLVENPSPTLFIVWVVEALIVALCYSIFGSQSDKCHYVKAVARGLLGLPIGAVLNAVGAILLGAPVGTRHWQSTLHWSLLMSVFTFVPVAAVFGSSSSDWHRVFALKNLTKTVDFMICFPAHGAVIGAWLGAWPMPLDWERPWQEWPICVTYGAILGYVVGMVISFVFAAVHSRPRRAKGD